MENSLDSAIYASEAHCHLLCNITTISEKRHWFKGFYGKLRACLPGSQINLRSEFKVY